MVQPGSPGQGLGASLPPHLKAKMRAVYRACPWLWGSGGRSGAFWGAGSQEGRAEGADTCKTMSVVLPHVALRGRDTALHPVTPTLPARWTPKHECSRGMGLSLHLLRGAALGQGAASPFLSPLPVSVQDRQQLDGSRR